MLGQATLFLSHFMGSSERLLVLSSCTALGCLFWYGSRLKSQYMACGIAYFQGNEGFSQISLVIRGLPYWFENLEKPQ